MAKYELRENASVTLDPVKGVSTYYKASPADPVVIEIPDDIEPSSRWKPLDDAARKAKKKLADFKALPPEKKLELKEKERLEREEEESKKAEEATAKAKRHDQEVAAAAAQQEKGKPHAQEKGKASPL